MEIVKIADGDKLKYKDLLLLADEQMSMIETYVYRGEMFVLYDGGVRASCVVTQEGRGIFEIKNIATLPQYQRQGYGRYLIEYILDYYQKITQVKSFLMKINLKETFHLEKGLLFQICIYLNILNANILSAD